MPSPASSGPENPFGPSHLAFLVLLVANIVVGKWMPGSLEAALVSYAFIGSMTIWFGLRIRTGYRRRRPYWTRESWLRYLRLIAMPAAATIFVLGMSTETGLRMLGPARSTTRNVSAVVLVVLLLFGALGLARAVDWLMEGPPPDQFTRRSWMPRRRSKAIAE
jgi:hypothetical protein